MEELLILFWNRDSYYLGNGSNWKPNTIFKNNNTKFIFTDNKNLINKCHIVLFGIHNSNENLINVDLFIKLLKNLQKPPFQKWFTLSSENRFEFKSEKIPLLLDAGIDKILYESFTPHQYVESGIIHRGITREYMGLTNFNEFGPNIFFNKPNLVSKKKKVFILYSHDARFDVYGNINNVPYDFPYKSRAEYLIELMSVFPCDSHGRSINNTGLLIDNHYEDTNVWKNKLTIANKYMFTCAIENCLEEIYSEKIFQAYIVSSIPIISVKNCFNILPNKSYISIHDFSSATELGKYLDKVANDKELYESYFEWKKHPETFKNNYPKFYNMITSSENPCFLKNLYNNEEIEDCDEESMRNFNKYCQDHNYQ